MKEGVHACTPLNYYRMYRYIFVLSAFGRHCFFIFMRKKLYTYVNCLTWALKNNFYCFWKYSSIILHKIIYYVDS